MTTTREMAERLEHADGVIHDAVREETGVLGATAVAIARELAPEDTGALRASLYDDLEESTPGDVRVALRSDLPYAGVMNAESTHVDTGRGVVRVRGNQYADRAMTEALVGFEDRLADRVSARLQGVLDGG